MIEGLCYKNRLKTRTLQRNVISKNKILSVLFLALIQRPEVLVAAPCNLNGTYLSTSLLSTLLTGNPSLSITSESTEITLRNGNITVSSEAVIGSPRGGSVSFTGDGILKGRAQYRVLSRGRRNFLAIRNIQRDLFTTRTFVNGELTSERDLRGIAFGDREIQFRCRGSQLDLFYDVSGRARQVSYTRR
jgi:hypothetical protein